MRNNARTYLCAEPNGALTIGRRFLSKIPASSALVGLGAAKMRTFDSPETGAIICVDASRSDDAPSGSSRLSAAARGCSPTRLSAAVAHRHSLRDASPRDVETDPMLRAHRSVISVTSVVSEVAATTG